MNSGSLRLRVDSGNLDGGQLSAEALTLLVTGLVLVLLNNDLRTAQVFNLFSSYLGGSQGLCVSGDLVTVNEQQYGQLDGATGFTCNTVKGNFVSDGDLLLARPPARTIAYATLGLTFLDILLLRISHVQTACAFIAVRSTGIS